MNVDSVDDPTSILLQVDDGIDLVDALIEHGWGDGLPVVAPTPERVEAMLAGRETSGTDVSPTALLVSEARVGGPDLGPALRSASRKLA